MNKYLSFWAGILGVIFFVGATILGGLQVSNYSHIAQLISETYAVDTPYGWEIRYFGFSPAGVLLTIFAFSAIRSFPRSGPTSAGFSGLAIFYGIATIVVSFFPCDKGCNKAFMDPSDSQIIHNLTGLLTYIFVPISLFTIGYSLRNRHHGKEIAILAIVVAINCVIFITILALDPLSKWAGLYQRIIEGGILFWIVVCALHIKYKIDHPIVRKN